MLALALGLAGRALARDWEQTRAVAAGITLDWPWILLASVMVLLTHAALVQCWRTLLDGWDEAPPYWTSARIWSISNFGKYLPGKVWSIIALKMLAGREGVSGAAATSAAIMGTLLNIGAGFGIVALSGTRALDALHWSMQWGAMVGAVCFVIGVVLLPRLLPPAVRWYTARRGLAPVDRHLSATRLWSVTAVNALSWIAYGLAFAAFSRGVTPQVAGAADAFITVYTASYLAGYLFILAPGGVVVREAVLATVLVALGMGTLPEATVLALASRVWITILEIAPGLVSLLFSSRLVSSPDSRRPPLPPSP
ncbi:MAG: lysylphosphatidylglycerol synthase domain-containing protein [Gemmatimonadota bacterium]